MKRKKKRKIDSELRASTFLMCAWISLFFVSIVNLIKSILDDKMSKPVYLTLAGVGLAVALCFIVCWVWVKISLKNKGDKVK